MARRANQEKREKIATPTVLKALHVLQSLAALCGKSPGGASAKEIAECSGEHPSSVCKHLAAFQQAGLVDQDSLTNRYRIGTYAIQLSTLALNSMNLRDTTSPYLQQLAEETGETVHLVVPDGLRVVYIDKVESTKTIRMHSHIGLRNPMYCTGVGKAILAYSPIALTDAVVAEGITAYTEKTLTSRDALMADYARIRSLGYAVDDSEHELEVRCAAAPIFNHIGQPIASISVAGPRWRMTDERLLQYGNRIRETAGIISGRFGYVPSP